MKLSGPSRRLSIFIGETDQYRHVPLYHEIVTRAKKAGPAGASVLRGIEGYGAGSRETEPAREAGDDPAPRQHRRGRSS